MRIAFGSDEKTALTDAVAADLEARGHELVLVGPLGGGDEEWAEMGRRVGALGRRAATCDDRRVLLLDGDRRVDRGEQGRGCARRAVHGRGDRGGARTWNDANVLVMGLRLTSAGGRARDARRLVRDRARSRRSREHRATGARPLEPELVTTAPAPERVSEVSRRLRARADGVVAELWFMPESQTGYPTLGISGAAGTFGGRTGPLGALPGAAAAALLVPLNPAFTGPPSTRRGPRPRPTSCSPLRERTATGYLAEIIGPEPEGIARAAELARRAADAGPVEGHPLAAAHRTRGWTDDPLVDVWRACERIRERRHESHRNAWTAAGLDACEICVLTDLWRGPLISSVSSSWSPAQQDERAGSAAGPRARRRRRDQRARSRAARRDRARDRPPGDRGRRGVG